MADLAEHIAAELENIDGVLALIPSDESLPDLSELELAGVASLLHSFYNGIENIIKQVFRAQAIPLPTGDSWHRDLVLMATEVNIISSATASEIGKYLAFRHFFSHAYAFHLDSQLLKPLVANIEPVYKKFRQDISRSAES